MLVTKFKTADIEKGHILKWTNKKQAFNKWKLRDLRYNNIWVSVFDSILQSRDGTKVLHIISTQSDLIDFSIDKSL